MPLYLNNISLSDKTTLKIGGPAHTYVRPIDEKEICECVSWAYYHSMPVLFLGKGSNILISDNGWPGLVIDLCAHSGIVWTNNCAMAKSGGLLHSLVKEMLDRKLCGLEKLAGIPGSIGGAVIMNAGAFGQSVSDCLTSVEYVDVKTLERKTVVAADLALAYRSTILKTTAALVLSARFCFKSDESDSSEALFREVLDKRKNRHPLDMPNCGSVFKNPSLPLATAGTLIEQAGLKGTMRGNAQVSQKHANFIVNCGGATASDVRALIVHVQKTVFEKNNIVLEPEVVFAGEFQEALFNPKI